jgi:hypothetical protein
MLVVLCLAFFKTPCRKSSKVPTSSPGLNLSRLKSGVFSADESLGKESAKGFDDPGGDRMSGLLIDACELLMPARCGTAWMLTLLAVCTVASDVLMPNPLPRRLWKRSATSSSSSPSCIGLGALLRPTVVASPERLEELGRAAGGLVGGEICVNPGRWVLPVKWMPGVLVALSGISDVSWMSGCWSAMIAPKQGKTLFLLLLPRECLKEDGGAFQPVPRLPYHDEPAVVLQWESFILSRSPQLRNHWYRTRWPPTALAN